MRDYWLTQYLLAAVGWTYIVVCLVAIALALWLPKTKSGKTIAGAIVLALASILPFQGVQEYRVEKTTSDDYKVRLAKAQALFDERCKTAEEKIYRNVDNVEGVLLMKVRPEGINFSDQYAMDDPYGRDVGGDGYIGSFLRATTGKSLNPRVAAGRQQGYRWVEAVNAADSQLYQYTGVIKSVEGRDPNFTLEKLSIAKSKARFGVTYEDISTREDRDNWIAGGTIKITDINTGEVIAQRVGYIFDAGLGDTNGFRGPWEAANACAGASRKYGHNAEFVFKSLKPVQGE